MCLKSCLPPHETWMDPYHSCVPFLCRSPAPPVVDTQDDRHGTLQPDRWTPVAPCKHINMRFFYTIDTNVLLQKSSDDQCNQSKHTHWPRQDVTLGHTGLLATVIPAGKTLLRSGAPTAWVWTQRITHVTLRLYKRTKQTCTQAEYTAWLVNAT